MKIGYARVSTPEQNLDMQLAALKAAGCEEVYSEKASGSSFLDRRKELKDNQPQLNAAIKALRSGDTLVVWAIDRLGRTTLKLMKLIEELNQKGVILEVITQKFDTTTVMGKAFLLFLAMFAENERNLIQERTRAGLQRIKAQGKRLGTTPKLKPSQVRQMWEIYSNPDRKQSVKEVAKLFNVSTKTLYNYLNPYIKEQRAKDAQNSLFPELPPFGEFPLTEDDIKVNNK